MTFKYTNIVADAGYESEENYLFLEGNGQIAFIKPSNYEISKTKKFKQDISRVENMDYDQKQTVIPARIAATVQEKGAVSEKKGATAPFFLGVMLIYCICNHML